MARRTLRGKDLDFDHGTIVARSGKGNKDRMTLLPRPWRGSYCG